MMTRPDLLRAGMLLSIGITVAACGGEDLVLPNEGEPASLAVVRGDKQR
jgi:hypothetical protein